MARMLADCPSSLMTREGKENAERKARVLKDTGQPPPGEAERYNIISHTCCVEACSRTADRLHRRALDEEVRCFPEIVFNYASLGQKMEDLTIPVFFRARPLDTGSSHKWCPKN